MPTNDNDPAEQRPLTDPPDPYGHAALLLVESLIHGLCEQSTLSSSEAITIVERAIDVQFDHAEAADAAEAPMWRAHALLLSIATSLKAGADDSPPPPRFIP